MSSRFPPDDPEALKRATEKARRIDRDLRRQTKAARPPGTEGEPLAVPAQLTMPVQRSAAISSWLATALQGITLAAIVGFAFWFSSLSNTVSNTSQKVDKLNDAVVGVSRDSLSNRLTVIETKLDAIDKRIETASTQNQRTGSPSR